MSARAGEMWPAVPPPVTQMRSGREEVEIKGEAASVAVMHVQACQKSSHSFGLFAARREEVGHFLSLVEVAELAATQAMPARNPAQGVRENAKALRAGCKPLILSGRATDLESKEAQRQKAACVFRHTPLFMQTTISPPRAPSRRRPFHAHLRLQLGCPLHLCPRLRCHLLRR